MLSPWRSLFLNQVTDNSLLFKVKLYTIVTFHFLHNTQGFRNEEVGEDLARGIWALAKC